MYICVLCLQIYLKAQILVSHHRVVLTVNAENLIIKLYVVVNQILWELRQTAGRSAQLIVNALSVRLALIVNVSILVANNVEEMLNAE